MGNATGRSGKRSIGNFDGNIEELAALMRASWRENQEQALDYDADFLRSAFEYPGCTPDLFPAIYHEGNLVAFIAGAPRAVRLAGQPLTLVNVSFLTVAPKYKRAGFGPLLWRELLQRARALGFEGAINFCVDGDDMNRQMLAIAQFCGQPTRQVFSVSYMAGLPPAATSGLNVEVLAGMETDIFLEAAARIDDRVSLARVWTPAEAEWQCRGRSGALSCAVAGERRGILSAYAIKTMRTPVTYIILDDVLWGDLTPAECAVLTTQFLNKAKERGAQMVIVPVLGYANAEPLVAAGFRKIRRTVHTYLTVWKDTVMPDTFTSMYIDVF